MPSSCRMATAKLDGRSAEDGPFVTTNSTTKTLSSRRTSLSDSHIFLSSFRMSPENVLARGSGRGRAFERREAAGRTRRGTRWGGEGPLPAGGPHLSHPASLRCAGRAPFFSRFAGEDEVPQISDSAFEQNRCVHPIGAEAGVPSTSASFRFSPE